MRVRFYNHPLWQNLLLSAIVCFSILAQQPSNAEGLDIPLQRSVATQPVTSLEVIAVVKTLLSGRVLSIKKYATYKNPDCHYVKFLEDKGEFHMIKVGCFSDQLVQTKIN